MQNFIIFASRYAEEFGFTAFDDLMGELGKIPDGPRHFMDALTRQDDFPVSARYAIGYAIMAAERERLAKGPVECSGESRYTSPQNGMTEIFERWRTPAAAEEIKVRQAA